MDRYFNLRRMALVFACLVLALPAWAGKRKEIYRSDVPLIDTIAKDDLASALALVHAGAPLNVVDKGDYTPLEFAISHGFEDIAEELLKAGADPSFPNRQGTTPLMMAAWSNDLGIGKLLLTKGVNVDAVDADGETALMATLHNCPDGMPFSLDGPADDDLKSKIDAHQSCAEGAMVQLLLDAGADPNVRSNTGVTALLIASIMGNKCAVVDLVRLGANPAAKDRFDRTPSTESCGRNGNRNDICKLVTEAQTNRIGSMQSIERKANQSCGDCCADTITRETIEQRSTLMEPQVP